MRRTSAAAIGIVSMDSRHEKYSSSTKKAAPIAPAPKKANLGYCLLLPQANQGRLGWIPKLIFYWPFSFCLLYVALCGQCGQCVVNVFTIY